jgi:hypothetical protein
VLHYEVDADIGGKLAQLGGQLVQNTARKLAAEFFERLEAELAPTATAEAEADTEPPAPPPAAAAPERAGQRWPWVLAALGGLAAIAWLLR